MRAPPPAPLRKVHPLGKSPVITDGSLTVAESGAIIEYLVERHGNVRLAAAARQRRMAAIHLLAALRRRLGHAAAAVHAGVRQDQECAMPFFIKPIARAIAGKVMDGFVTPNHNSQSDFMEAELKRSSGSRATNSPPPTCR